MAIYLPDALRARLDREGRSCSYCLTRESLSGISLCIDHIFPRSLGGETTYDNVCYSCRSCNEFKADAISGTDPLTGERVSLFHPRRQQWADHFAWSADGSQVVGQTASGRATVITLRMNNSTIVSARARWCLVGWHPPPS